MATITLKYDGRSKEAKNLLNVLLATGVFVEKVDFSEEADYTKEEVEEAFFNTSKMVMAESISKLIED